MTHEELAKKKQDGIDSLKNYKLPEELADKVIHVRPDKIVFSYHFQRVDLRTATPSQILQLAKSKDCPYLQEKEDSVAKTKAAVPGEPENMEKETGKKTGK